MSVVCSNGMGPVPDGWMKNLLQTACPGDELQEWLLHHMMDPRKQELQSLAHSLPMVALLRVRPVGRTASLLGRMLEAGPQACDLYQAAYEEWEGTAEELVQVCEKLAGAASQAAGTMDQGEKD